MADKRIGIVEFRHEMRDVLDKLLSGEYRRVVLTRHDHDVAVVMPVGEYRRAVREADVLRAQYRALIKRYITPSEKVAHSALSFDEIYMEELIVDVDYPILLPDYAKYAVLFVDTLTFPRFITDPAILNSIEPAKGENPPAGYLGILHGSVYVYTDLHMPEEERTLTRTQGILLK